ncbi:MAG: TrkH family potassium uptake protein [Candidatus Cloacimonetes bacterium]|nr:TrkH family potassium uptake protein [Candidatus Cloacimonadota bacterium]
MKLKLKTFLLSSPPRIVLLSFALAILIGSVLLWLPQASTNSGSLSYCDALFTATSATCVTGLIVVDTGIDFTHFGQIVILILIQIGGLGIMTISTFFMYLISGRLNIFDRDIIFDAFSQDPIRNFKRLLMTVFGYTAALELLGACLLFTQFISSFSLKRAIYLSIFHSVSAFCNAGFSLFSDSFIAYQGHLLTNIVICVLIVTGGLGFVVVFDILSKRKIPKRMFWTKLSLHSRLVLMTTAILILSGTILFLILERNNSLAGMNSINSIMVSLFQSITTRIAGFNSVDIGMLRNSTLFLFIILMFIGASPGSCGGGIKTTTFLLFLLSMKARFRMQSNVSIFSRGIPKATISKVTAIIFFSLFIIIAFTLLLLITELPEVPHDQTRGSFLVYLFEIVSAYATVGLSMGITPHLQNISKFCIIILMYIGRLGPLTLAIALKSRNESKLKYMEENILVG